MKLLMIAAITAVACCVRANARGAVVEHAFSSFGTEAEVCLFLIIKANFSEGSTSTRIVALTLQQLLTEPALGAVLVAAKPVEFDSRWSCAVQYC